MKLVRSLLLALGFSALAGCATPWQVAEVQDVAGVTATGGSAFTRALMGEYRDRARLEAEVEYEWRHAVLYARKAQRAAAGEVVQPEILADWDLPAAALPMLAEARARLVDALDNGARDRVPDIAATAQATFDCWVEEAWENEDDNACRDAVQSLLPKLQPPPEPVAEAPPPTFVVYFDFDKAALTPESRRTLDEVAKAVAQFKPAAVRVSGHTDTVGGPRYNDRLSKRRADVVAKALTEFGVPTASVRTESFGKTKPAVSTGNNVKELRNRRVEIVLEGVRLGALATPPVPVARAGAGVGSAAPDHASPILSAGAGPAASAPPGVVPAAPCLDASAVATLPSRGSIQPSGLDPPA